MRMLRWICGNTMMNKIRNKEFMEKVGFEASLRKDAGKQIEMVWACAEKDT